MANNMFGGPAPSGRRTKRQEGPTPAGPSSDEPVNTFAANQRQRPTAAATVAEEKKRLADVWAGANTAKRNIKTRNGGGNLR